MSPSKIPRPMKVSKKWLKKKVDCTAEGRKKCGGRCCMNGRYGTYGREEISKLPHELRDTLVPKGEFYVVPTDEKNNCSFISTCLKHPEYKPLRCWLAPLKINKNNTLILQQFCTLHCPNYGKGDEIWKTLKNDLVYVFGSKFYSDLSRIMSNSKNKSKPLRGAFK